MRFDAEPEPRRRKLRQAARLTRAKRRAVVAADRRAGRKSLFLTLGNHVGLRSISLSLLLRVRISAVRRRRSDEGTQ